MLRMESASPLGQDYLGELPQSVRAVPHPVGRNAKDECDTPVTEVYPSESETPVGTNYAGVKNKSSHTSTRESFQRSEQCESLPNTKSIPGHPPPHEVHSTGLFVERLPPQHLSSEGTNSPLHLSAKSPSQQPDLTVNKTAFGIPRYALLAIVIVYTICIGSHFYNWVPWEEILLDFGAFSSLCPTSGEICASQRTAIGSLLPLTGVAMLSFTFVAGTLLDVVGPKICCLAGNCLLTLGWGLLAMSTEERKLYRVGFFFVGAGTDPAFFGTLTLANLFPGYGSTVIAVFGGARSLSMVIPFGLQYISMRVDGFGFHEITYCFLIAYAVCFLTAALVIPWRPYELQFIPRKSSLDGLQRYRSEESLVGLAIVGAASRSPVGFMSMSSVSKSGVKLKNHHDRTPDNIFSEKEINNEVSDITTDRDDDGAIRIPVPHSPPPSSLDTFPSDTPKHGNTTTNKSPSSWRHRFFHQLNIWGSHVISPLYWPIVIIFAISYLRNNFFLVSATVQLGHVKDVLTWANIVSFFPAPIFGLIVDRYGPLSVITGISSCYGVTYLCLLTSPFVSEAVSTALRIVSVVFVFPGIVFLVSQLYCYVAVIFPPEHLGKLAGFASCLAGVFGLVANPLYSWGFRSANFVPVNVIFVAVSVLVLIPIGWLFYLLNKKEKDGSVASSVRQDHHLSDPPTTGRSEVC